MKQNSILQNQTVQVANTRLRAQRITPGSPSKIDSQKPTLVFLHDAIGSIEQWRGFPEELVRLTDCPALVYDRQGYGHSDALTQKRNSQYLEEEALKILPEVLRVCQIKKTILIGHSDGGSIALIFAGACPNDIHLQGIITEAAHVFVEEITLEGLRKVLHWAEISDFKKKLSKFHGEKTETLFSAWIDTWLAETHRHWNIEKYLSPITCPSLIIQGEEDEYGSPAQVEAILRQVKGEASSLLIPHCAHIPHYQAKKEVLKAMQDFILQKGHSLGPL
ncbi:MAG: alpha/beta hydrolase [Deltaproteobacteria bacterium]|nr:alpha/beta hydrolase [Deltaproteobacteria bacterium]